MILRLLLVRLFVAVLPILLMMVVVIKLLSMICSDLAVFRCKEGDLLPEKMTLSQELPSHNQDQDQVQDQAENFLEFRCTFHRCIPSFTTLLTSNI